MTHPGVADPDWHPFHHLAAGLARRVRAFQNGDVSGVMAPDSVAQAERLRSCAMRGEGGRYVVDGPFLLIVASLRHARGMVLGEHDPEGRGELALAVELFALLGQLDRTVVPPPLRARVDAMRTPDVEELAVLGGRGLASFERWSTTSDPESLDAAVSTLRDCGALVPEGHPGGPTVLSNLCGALQDRYALRRAAEDLDEAIEAGRAAVAAAHPGDPNRWLYNASLGGALVALPDRSPEVLDEAVSCGREAVAFASCPAVFHFHLGQALLARATAGHGDPNEAAADLDEAVDAFGHAVRKDPRASLHQVQRGLTLHARYSARAHPADLRAALEHTAEALRLTSRSDPSFFRYLIAHAQVLATRAELSDGIGDLEDLIGVLRQALDAAPRPWRAERLQVLAVALHTRFGLTQAGQDLDEAIRLCHEAIGLCEPGEDEQIQEILRTILRIRLEGHGPDEKIAVLEANLAQVPRDSPRYAAYATELGSLLLRRALWARHTGDDHRLASYLERAVSVLRRGTGPTALFNLGRALDLSYERGGAPALLDESLRCFEAALEATGPQDSSYPRTLSSLATVLLKRADRHGDLAALHRAVELNRGALAATPEGHPDRAGVLIHLAKALAVRHDRLMTEEDLAEAVRRGREAVAAETAQRSAHERSVAWNNLGMYLRRTYERSHALDDLEEAIDALRRAVEAAEGGADGGDAGSNLCLALNNLFCRTGEPTDLNEAVDAGRLATDAFPAGHVKRAGAMTNLSSVLMLRARLTGRRGDADEAVRYARTAVGAVPRPHPDRCRHLSSLASALLSRFLVSGDAADREEAADAARQALNLLPEDDWRRVGALGHLGDAHVCKALHELGHEPVSGESPLSEPLGNSVMARLGPGPDELGRPALREAVAAYREAAAIPGVPATNRFSAAASWAACASALGDWPEALTAYRAAFAHLPAMAWHGLELDDRVSVLSLWDSIAPDAAAAALHLGRPDTALQLLEQGRGVLLAQAIDSRLDLTALTEYDAELARRIEGIRAALHAPNSPLADAAPRRRRELAAELDALTDRAFRLLGLESLLEPPTLEELQEAAADGAVIVVNTSVLRCDALIVTRDTVRTVPLPGLEWAWVKERAEALLTDLAASSDAAGQSLEETLRELQQTVVQPVLDELPPSVSRLWWCPTGPLTLLPVHAVDPLPDHYVCSYATTLRSLAAARTRQSYDDPGAVLVVEQAEVPELRPLPAARREALNLVTRLRERTLLTGPMVTPRSLRRALPRHACLHFAGHAGHDPVHPARGGLHCHEGRLTVADISRLRLGRAELAFLSACETARGTESLPDEPVHLAGALQLAGFTHVVATRWMVRDDIAGQLAEHFYKELCRDGRPEPAGAASALQSAVRDIKQRHHDPLLWAAYVHTGP
ncbi:CHAT domain-containing protein [Streptomyces sp. NPDC005017]|uniref:CHAT domain-containing protein n=1 Tax=Streptomyces sp. NPDC005017 TaxID=3364706 RepID=UPI003678515D